MKSGKKITKLINKQKKKHIIMGCACKGGQSGSTGGVKIKSSSVVPKGRGVNNGRVVSKVKRTMRRNIR